MPLLLLSRFSPTGFVGQFVKIAENEVFCRILLTRYFHSNCGKHRGKILGKCLFSQQSTEFSTKLWKTDPTYPQDMPSKTVLSKSPKSTLYTKKQRLTYTVLTEKRRGRNASPAFLPLRFLFILSPADTIDPKGCRSIPSRYGYGRDNPLPRRRSSDRPHNPSSRYTSDRRPKRSDRRPE